jgi:hypothetical protein
MRDACECTSCLKPCTLETNLKKESAVPGSTDCVRNSSEKHETREVWNKVIYRTALEEKRREIRNREIGVNWRSTMAFLQ